ncbi:hypothetical protein B0H13DRAFT_1879151 [Mycena leptocephala]|nr:hypothetical protein B0H13DRAFT_1879151 [Mycena leptocephala]
MADLAETYHENFQSGGPASPEEQEEAEKAALNDVKKLSQQNKAKLSQYLTRGEIARVLKRPPTVKPQESKGWSRSCGSQLMVLCLCRSIVVMWSIYWILDHVPVAEADIRFWKFLVFSSRLFKN